MKADAEFVCPHCRAALESTVAAMECSVCRRCFPIREGIVQFADPDAKYEQTEPRWWDRGEAEWTLPFVDAGITWFFSRFLPANAVVLDVGCGTGIRYIARRAKAVYGIDRAPSRLKKAAEIYKEVSVASLFEIPYPDGFFDAVISVDVLEHIPNEIKDRAINEMKRVVRAGGRMVHILDLDSDKPLHRWARRDPELYQRYFIEQLGHYGLEPATEAVARFERAGMKMIAVEPTNRTSFQLPGNFAWQFDNEYRFRSRWVRLLTSLSYVIRRHKVLDAVVSGVYQLAWTRWIEPFFPINWSFNLAIACEVPSESAR